MQAGVGAWQGNRAVTHDGMALMLASIALPPPSLLLLLLLLAIVGFILSCACTGRDRCQPGTARGIPGSDTGTRQQGNMGRNWFMSDLVSSCTLCRKAEISLKRTPAVVESYCRSAAPAIGVIGWGSQLERGRNFLEGNRERDLERILNFDS